LWLEVPKPLLALEFCLDGLLEALLLELFLLLFRSLEQLAISLAKFFLRRSSCLVELAIEQLAFALGFLPLPPGFGTKQAIAAGLLARGCLTKPSIAIGDALLTLAGRLGDLSVAAVGCFPQPAFARGLLGCLPCLLFSFALASLLGLPGDIGLLLRLEALLCSSESVKFCCAHI